MLSVGSASGSTQTHNLEIKLNGQVLRTENAINAPRLIQFELGGISSGLKNGPNTLTLRRTGGIFAGFIVFDYVMVEYLPVRAGDHRSDGRPHSGNPHGGVDFAERRDLPGARARMPEPPGRTWPLDSLLEVLLPRACFMRIASRPSPIPDPPTGSFRNDPLMPAT